MKNRVVILFTALFIALAVPGALFANGVEDASDTMETAQAKYVFLFIGDGMALPQISATEAYLNYQNSSNAGVRLLAMSQFPAQGLTTTYSADRFITDSAAAATAIACGQKTNTGVIAMNSSATVGLKTIAEMAKEAGMKVGILSSVNLDHATPASFYAHFKTRNDYYEISRQMANSDFDYFAGGMVRLDKTPEGQKNAIDMMKDNGWEVTTTRSQLNTLQPSDKQVYAYYATSFTRNSIDYTLDQESDDITLAEYTKKGIELLDNPNGFFMMVEGGKIDWACHANDAGSSIGNTIAFDDAIKEAVAFYNRHPDETLIVVTGDHECGGLTLGFAGTQYDSAFADIGKQNMSYEAFDNFVIKPFRADNPNGSLADLLPEIEKGFGLTNLSDYEMQLLETAFENTMLDKKERAKDEATYLNYGGYEPLSVTITHILNNRAGLAWTSYSHTAVPVPTFAMGAGQSLFNGYYDNTDIFKKTAAVMGLGQAVSMAR